VAAKYLQAFAGIDLDHVNRSERAQNAIQVEQRTGPVATGMSPSGTS